MRGHLLLALLVLLVGYVSGWTQWEYDTAFSMLGKESDQGINLKNAWKVFWTDEPPIGWQDSNKAPRPRRGHSMVPFTSPAGSPYGATDMVVMFGGRDNDGTFRHIPRTYKVESVNGTFVFTTYDKMPVNLCFDDGTYYDIKEIEEKCKTPESKDPDIDIGIIYNDVWAYIMCPFDDGNNNVNYNRRYWDSPCVGTGSGWIVLNIGALEGGCVIQLGFLVCTHPSERYSHSIAMFDDGTMYVYGGYSLRCQDFCDDIWYFDVFMKSWKQLYLESALQRLYFETFGVEKYYYSYREVPSDNSSREWSDGTVQSSRGPGKRWKATMTVGPKYFDPSDPSDVYPTGRWKQQFAFFGGFRIWHGFYDANYEGNNWEDYNKGQYGGYLDDFWIYTKYLDTRTNPGENFMESSGLWHYVHPRTQTIETPGISFESRFDLTTITLWPGARSSNGFAWDASRNIIWLFGGYRTYFPYLRTDGAGAGPGVSASTGGAIPYPGYDYFLNDLWYYNLTDGYWTQIEFDQHDAIPEPRAEFVFLFIDEILFLHGGYADNYYFDDVWYFNITSHKWLKKSKFIYPEYSKNCTDDEQYIKDNPGCIKMEYALHLSRNESAPFNILPYSMQPYYWPDQTNGPYWEIQQKGFDGSGNFLSKSLKYTEKPPDGTPQMPYAGTGPLQYARKFHYAFNNTHSALIWEYCVSVFAEPTRHQHLDGLFGRANESIKIPQVRRQRPGWDGCRDRADGRMDLKQNAPDGDDLAYQMPSARAAHAAVYFNSTREIIMYGGTAYQLPQKKSLLKTYPTVVKDDMWLFGFGNCINNCSFRGDCYYNFCICYPGYYGVDCSNISCPGTSCYYDEYTHEQVCVHGCQAGYKHQDNDTYVQDIAKVACSRSTYGFHETNGVCDGFGTTYCNPPYIGDDCSVKDCKHNCSFNGYCSVEFPVSRCVCQPGYFGEICDSQICLNNCSYPNGLCNTTNGVCNCNMMYNPYNNTMEFHAWDGEDCSYLHAYSGAFHLNFNYVLTSVFTFIIIPLCLWLSNSDFSFIGDKSPLSNW